MYKDKYKEHYFAVLVALRKLHAVHGLNETIRLYINDDTGLNAIPYPELKDILVSMDYDRLIKIKGYPSMFTLLYEDKPIKDTLPHLFESLLDKSTKENYYQIVINPGRFKAVYNYFCIPRYVLGAIPSDPDDGKYEVIRGILKLLVDSKTVDSFTIANIFIRVRDEKYLNRTKKLTRKDYKAKKTKYDEMIKNRLKTIRKLLKQDGYTVTFKNDELEIVELQG